MVSTVASKEPLLILCGGRSRRMGSPKPLLPFRGVPLIERLAAAGRRQPLWLAAAEQRFPNIQQVIYLSDALPDRQGALSAILPALQIASKQGYEGIYVHSCDTLLLPEQVADCLQHARGSAAWRGGVAALQDEGRDYPLLAHWSASLAEPLLRYLESGQRRVTTWLQTVPFATAPLPKQWQLLCNFNTPEEFELAMVQAEWLFARQDD